MNGWEIEAFPTLKIFHHRHTGEGGNLIRYKFRQGRMDYGFGSDPRFEILKCLLRLPDKPFLIGCIARLTGFAWSWIHRDQRPVSDEFVAFMRNEQKARLMSMFKRANTGVSKEKPQF